MSGLLAKALAQALTLGFSVVTGAFSKAYAQAKAGGGAVSSSAAARLASRMPPSQAREVLNLDPKAALTREAVMKQFNKYYAANDPETGGSFYVQSKVFNAKEVILEELSRGRRAVPPPSSPPPPRA